MQTRWFQLAKLSSVGLEMALAILIGWGIGYLLDKKLGTSPWLMILFLLFGVGAAFKGLFRAAREARRHQGESKG